MWPSKNKSNKLQFIFQQRNIWFKNLILNKLLQMTSGLMIGFDLQLCICGKIN